MHRKMEYKIQENKQNMTNEKGFKLDFKIQMGTHTKSLKFHDWFRTQIINITYKNKKLFKSVQNIDGNTYKILNSLGRKHRHTKIEMT